MIFKKPEPSMKIVHLHVILNIILNHTGVKVFNISDNKAVMINKLMENLGTISVLIIQSTV